MVGFWQAAEVWWDTLLSLSLSFATNDKVENAPESLEHSDACRSVSMAQPKAKRGQVVLNSEAECPSVLYIRCN